MRVCWIKHKSMARVPGILANDTYSPIRISADRLKVVRLEERWRDREISGDRNRLCDLGAFRMRKWLKERGETSSRLRWKIISVNGRWMPIIHGNIGLIHDCLSWRPFYWSASRLRVGLFIRGNTFNVCAIKRDVQCSKVIPNDPVAVWVIDAPVLEKLCSSVDK